MTQKKLFKLLTLAAFVAMAVVAPQQLTAGCQKKAGCEKKMMAEGCSKMEGQGCMMFKDIPNLSDEQKGKLEKLHAEHQKMMAAAMAEMQKKCQAHQQEVRVLLNDEQKAKFDKMGCRGMMHGMGCCGMMHGMGCMAHKGCCAKPCCRMKHGMKMEAKECPMYKKEKEEEKK